MIETFLIILIVILGVLISVSLHELGHFIPAKLFKVPTTEYFICFGPKIWSIKRGETEYGIKAIPLGGHTTIQGMFPSAKPGHIDKHFKNIIQGAREESLEGMEPFDEKRAFYHLSTPKKLVVMMGGTLTNLVIGGICIIIAFSVIGSPAPSTQVNVIADSPAAAAGLTDNAKIVGVNDKVFGFNDWGEVVDAIANSEEYPIHISYSDPKTFEVESDDNGNTVTKYQITDADVYPTGEKGSYKIGIKSIPETKHLSVGQSLLTTGDVTVQTVKAIAGIPVGLFNSVKTLIFGEPRDQNGLVSVIGLGQVAVATDKQIDDFPTKVANILAILGSLNIALFVFNLIPLLPLDGGHSANAIYEGIVRTIARIRKKPRPAPSDLARSMPIAYIVFGILIFMFVVVALLDILHPIM